MEATSVNLELTNLEDLICAEHGHLRPEQVRRLNVRGVVDTAETRLVIPAFVAERLGLEISRATWLRKADGRIVERPVAKGVHLAYAGRECVFSGIVDPERDTAIIGVGVMQMLDLIIDDATHCLVPRDPDRIIVEIE